MAGGGSRTSGPMVAPVPPLASGRPPGVRVRRSEWESCSVFNMKKVASRGRRIVDRRGPNGMESQILDGPSSSLFPAYRFGEIILQRHREGLRASGTDRRDMYYQVAVTRERAATNAMGPAWRREHLAEFTTEFDDLDEEERATLHRRRSRLLGGDAFLQKGRDEVRADLLGPKVHLDGRRPIPAATRYELLCIDDFVSLGRVAAADLSAAEGDDAQGGDLQAFDEALCIYDVTGLKGDPARAKDWRARLSWTAVGAEVLSKRGWVLRGYVPAGSLWSRRLGLSFQSLRAARFPFLSGRLGGVLASSWTSVFGFQRPLLVILEELFQLSNIAEDQYHPLTRKQADELVLAGILAPLAETNLAAQVESRIFAMDASPSHGAVCHVDVPEQVAESLWVTGERRGGYTRLETKARTALRGLGSLSP